MTNILLALIVILGISLLKHFDFLSKKTSELHKLFQKVNSILPDVSFDSILLINSNVSSDIEVLVPELSQNWVILYNGPEWLFNIKKRKWGRRCLSFQKVIGRRINLYKRPVIIMKKNKGYSLVFEVEQFIKYTTKQS
ncbi:hypothetical protein KZ483_25890 [Paenibacillus sp. sptzw28]|uniref:hypothetical protein n=1 Tax=Paenibacillus sp. sptzw28 TaxID=715179 RepID=UPI001C6E25CB|nr:hypothetical protein [Paenibacillus sp. sptzw28]QYR21107.1 hypothetical protein KZ483_25890 [Paenibacillus sp. sptzw28]